MDAMQGVQVRAVVAGQSVTGEAIELAAQRGSSLGTFLFAIAYSSCLDRQPIE